eukprot:NODE_1133_length_994_cov_175.998847_g1088_i0.p1 GENE.NODE_1133_length_994_cov_175.998847_g1088_i0~~NODE_1133_length_994_cov_175.998847_g1088_i0.p1  ORF type:complete len:260 (+),score=43.53 NODE_1133_length_994_cov_175.998847_g1088_i0:84-863(+)
MAKLLLAALATVFLAFQATAHPIGLGHKTTPKCVAHRGSSGLHPENSMEAFRAAEDEGCHGIEFDLHLSADKYVVIMHDSSLSRTTNCTGNVGSLSYQDYISTCTLSNGETVPVLEDMLEFFETSEMEIFLFDFKGRNLEMVELICKTLVSWPVNFQKQIVLGGWTSAEIETAADHCPEFSRSLISSVAPLDVGNYDVVNFNINHGSITNNFLDRARANSQSVYGWTINNESDMLRGIDMGFDAVLTDYPTRYLDLLEK